MKRKAFLMLLSVLLIGTIAYGQGDDVDEALARIMAIEYRREVAPLRTLLPGALGAEILINTEMSLLNTGGYVLSFSPDTAEDGSEAGGGFVLARPSGDHVLLMRPLGEALNLFQMLTASDPQIVSDGPALSVTFRGNNEWADAALLFEVYPNAPGLVRTRLELSRSGTLPANPALEWTFFRFDPFEEAPADMTWYADPAPFAAPAMYSYSGALDATVLYVTDRTALNPLFHAGHISPTQFPGRRGRSFGHGIRRSDLRALPENVPFTIYDAYLYLMPGEPLDETAMYARFLSQMSDIYDLLHKPVDTILPDWRSLGEQTIHDLETDAGSWVTLNERRYARAYWSDTRQSAELISQLDVLGGIVRYEAVWGEVTDLDDDLWAVLPDFFDSDYGMLINSGPVFLGQQGRGDTWYELGHALRAAELALETGDATAQELALQSGAQWIDFAHTVDYQFPQFYDFDTWQGVGREPDAAGGYALYMLELWSLTGEDRYLEEAQAAVEAMSGHGFRLAYETHMTAAGAAACARLFAQSGDVHYLDLALGPIANLVRLSWLWESDYGPSVDYRTFWGLSPTQESGVITAKEQYEAWVYLRQFVNAVTPVNAVTQIEDATYPDVYEDAAKLTTEFLAYTLTTLPYTLPPFLPEEIASPVATTYDTVPANNLTLYIPLEDLRHGWQSSGGIGQEVYGAGMAPTLGALAYQRQDGVTVYSPVPVEFDGDQIVFLGTPQNHFPVQVWGANPQNVGAESCDGGWCFVATGQQMVALRE